MSSSGLKVTALAPYYPPASRAGGPVRSVSAIAAAAALSHDVAVITRAHDLGDPERLPGIGSTPHSATVEGVPVTYLGRGMSLLGQMIRTCRRRGPVDVLYLNSLWDPQFSLLPLLLWRLRLIESRLVLIAPRGETGTAALAIRSWKKRLVLWLVSWMLRGPRVWWHATNDLEAQSLGSLLPGAEARTLVWKHSLPEPRSSGRRDEGVPKFLFLGRVAPIKGLDLALQALADVRAPVEFSIAGAHEDAAYWGRCQFLIGSLPDNVTVRILGHVSPTEVSRLVQKSDVLLLPTGGENFGHAIADALAAGCAVVIPDTTPWSDVVAPGGGLVAREPWAISRVVEDLATDPAKLRAAREACFAAYQKRWREHHAAAPQTLFDLVLKSAR